MEEIKVSKQVKISISFKDNEVDQKLYNWILNKSDIVGMSGTIKLMLYEKYKEEQEGSK